LPPRAFFSAILSHTGTGGAGDIPATLLMAEVSTSSDSPVQRRVPATGFSPAPGCVIFLIGGMLLLGGVIWAVYTFTRQLNQLESFTDPSPLPLPVRAVTPQEVSALREKLAGFAAETNAGRAPTLTLSVDELNTLLAGFDRFAELKNLVTIERTDGSRISARISFPLNTLPGRRAYLNGIVFFKPDIKPKAGFCLLTEDINVPGRTVPPGFLDVYQRGIMPGKTLGFLDDMLVSRFRPDKEVGPILTHIQRVEVTDGKLTVTAAPGVPKRTE
jgi:hypothetical protein